MGRSLKSVFTALALASLFSVPLGPSAQAADDRGQSRTVVELARKSGPGEPLAQRARMGPAPFSASLQERKNRIPEESKKKSKDRLELAEKMNGQTRVRMGAAAAQAAEIDIVDCQNSQYSYSQTGFVIDHFSWCQAGYYVVTIKRCSSSGSCTTVGKANFRLTTIGYGTDGSRKIEFVTLMDEVKLSGDTAQVSAQSLRLSMNCTAYLEATCTADSNNGRTDTIAGWQNVPSTFYRFTSPLEGTSGAEQISWYDFQQSLTLVGANSVDMGGNGFRCDSATYVNNPGCVFDLVNELWYDLSVSDPEVNETAQHIYDAQYRPELTFPWFEGKTVPGSIDSAEPLSRVYHDRALRDANHRKAVSTCKKVYGDDYASRGLDCDEYPFQSTYQGAAAGDNRYSARALTSSDNQKAGSKLAQWYGSQRILDSDHFFVIIIS